VIGGGRLNVPRLTLALSAKDLALAVAVVAVAAVVLGGSQLFIGPHTALSGYLTILFLLSITRIRRWRARLITVAWAMAVAVLGFLLGGIGLWVTLIAVVVVSMVQAFATVGESAMLTRSPANLLAFAALGQEGAEIWQVLLGSTIGAGVILAFAAVSRSLAREVGEAMDLTHRLAYGVATSVGAFVIVLGAELTGFPYVNWMLLSLTIVLSVGADQRAARSLSRVVGSLLGVFVGVLLALLPEPWPLAAAIVCVVLCVAYVNAGNHAMFVLLLTPAILLTTTSESSSIVLGALRVEAVLIATGIAMICSLAAEWAIGRAARRLSAHGSGRAA
jgi:hypothetical protein